MKFTHRNCRPPADPVNSLLSFAYTLTFYNIVSYLHARGLDPALGIYHEMSQGHPALASDLLEEFRAPVVDALVISVINRNQIGPADFHYAEGNPQPCLLRDEARARFLHAFEEKMSELHAHPDAAHPVDWRRTIDLQVCRLLRYIQGAVSEYRPFEIK